MLGLPELFERWFSPRDSIGESIGDALFAAATQTSASVPPTWHVLTFSMDRTIQLHALLESYAHHVHDAPAMTVLYRATSPAHERAYDELREAMRGRAITFVRQESPASFRPQVLTRLREIDADRIFFLVDDILFIEPVDLGALSTFDPRDTIVSLRLGRHLTRAYTMNASQPLPPLTTLSVPGRPEDFVSFRFTDGVHDWGYPLSVDGHVFHRAEFLAMLERTEFRTPNTLETRIQKHRRYFERRRGVAFSKGRILNVPCNKVQSDNKNVHGGLHQDELLARWNAGETIDFRALAGFTNESCHQEVEFTYKKRTP